MGLFSSKPQEPTLYKLNIPENVMDLSDAFAYEMSQSLDVPNVSKNKLYEIIYFACIRDYSESKNIDKARWTVASQLKINQYISTNHNTCIRRFLFE